MRVFSINNNNNKVLKNELLQRIEVSMLFTISYLPNLIVNTLKKKTFKRKNCGYFLQKQLSKSVLDYCIKAKAG